MGVFGPFQAPGGRKICPSPSDPSNNQYIANFSKNSGESTQRRQPPNVVRARQLRNANAVPMSQNIPENWPVAPSYGQKGFWSVGSLTNKTGPQPTKWPPAPPKKRPYLGSQGHVGPLTGFTGSAFSMRSNLVGGRFAQSGPQDRETPLSGAFGPFRALGGRDISLSPRPQKTSKSRISRKNRVEPPNVVGVRKLRTATAVQLSQKFPENSPVAPSYG